MEVYGPPELGVVVRHPDVVTQNQIFDLLIDITNLSRSPALYTSLDLFVGGGLVFVNANDTELPADASQLRSFGHIQPGQTVSAAFRVKSKLEGDVIACQALAARTSV